MKKNEIKLLNNINKIPIKENFVFSALNLAFLAYLGYGTIKISKNFFLWCDGILGQFLYKSKKIPGNQFIKYFYKFKYKEIVIIGNYSNYQIKYFKKKFKSNVYGIKLPIVNQKNIKRFIPKIKKNSLILITLPTPKQEMLSYEIIKKNKHYKIICIGGGLSITTGEIKKCPKILSKLGLEFAWRLRTDTFRRLKRLFFTFSIYLYFTINKKLKRFKIIKI